MTLFITAVASYPVGAAPKVTLTATSTTGTPNPVPANTLISVIRVHADGTRHRVVTEDAPRLLGGGWAWVDVHAPFNQAVWYEITAAGSAAASSSVTVAANRTWLVHSAQAALAVKVDVVSEISDRAAKTRSAKFVPFGSPAVFLSEGLRDGINGSFVVRVTDETPLEALFADDSVVLVNTPNTTGWDLGWMWIQPGDITYSNKAGLVAYKYRHVTVNYEQCDDPTVELQPVWTSGGAYAYWTTSQGKNSGNMVALYATSLDFLTDTRL